MAPKWYELPLEECMDAIIDYRGKTPKKTSTGIPLITAKIIKGGTIQPVTEFISESDYESWMCRGIPHPGDVVLTTEAPLGEVAQLGTDKVALAQRVITLRGKDGLLDNTYLKYLFTTKEMQAQLDGRSSGTTVSGIKQSELRKVTLRFPAITEQKAIAHILGALDDKIELNRKMNTTLESMAQALFKSWFVDFDPVIDNALAAGNDIPDALQAKAEQRKALGYKRKPLPDGLQQQFPDRFVFTEEMGWVPEGWQLGALSDIAQLVTKSAHPNKQPDKQWVHFSIPAFDDGMWPSIDLGETIKSGKYLVPDGCVLVSKLNPQFPRIWMPDVQDEEYSVCSTEFMPFVPLSPCERPYLYSILRSEKVQAEIVNRVTGSTGSRQRVKPREIAELSLLVQPSELRSAYSEFVGSQFYRQAASNRQILVLTKIRDTLLPKLLSGELRIPDAEKQIAEVV